MGPGKYENIGKSQPVLIVDGPIISPRTRIHSHRHLVTLTGAPETHHRARSTGDAMASGLELIPNASAENPYMQETVRPGNPPPNQMPLPTSAPPASQPASPSVGRSCTTPPPPQHAGSETSVGAAWQRTHPALLIRSTVSSSCVPAGQALPCRFGRSSNSSWSCSAMASVWLHPSPMNEAELICSRVRPLSCDGRVVSPAHPHYPPGPREGAGQRAGAAVLCCGAARTCASQYGCIMRTESSAGQPPPEP
jgi:hypothetical protein